MSAPSILMLLTYAVEGAHSLRVCRAMRERGLDVGVSYHSGTEGAYAEDPLDDFRSSGAVLDLTTVSPYQFRRRVEQFIAERNVRLIVQVGCEPLYVHLPSIREAHPELRLLDLLYNEVGHVVSHFLFERCFDATLVESRHLEATVRSGSEMPNPRIHVVESGIEVDLFDPRPPEAWADALTVGYVGRMSSEKNPLGFVRIAEALANEDGRLRFLMFGSGPQREEVEQAVEASPVRERLRFGGYARTVQDALAQVDVIVVPSLLDGRPNVIMEANASGTPVVAAPVGGIPEMIEDGVNGHLCRPDEFVRLRGLVGSWLAEPESLARLRRGARAVAESRFTRARMVDEYARVFRAYLP